MNKITWILVIVGGLNWLLQGIFGSELGDWVLGGIDTWPSRILYILVGLSALYQIFMGGEKHKSGMSSQGQPGGM